MALQSTESIKKWLNRGHRLHDNIKALEKAKQRAWEVVTGTTSVLCERVQESHVNGTANKMTEYIEYVQRIEVHKKRLFMVLSEIENAIMQVDDNTLRSLLIYRYLNFMTWENIAVEMHYSYKHIVHCLHPKALMKIEKVIECNNKNAL